ncbi:MAG: HAMP domain-containing sensor histidine kinase [Roseiflexaceae bacterium]|nr:HAMP domain-containing sensor histidine kinase [Roseiflexaceae bacterium]
MQATPLQSLPLRWRLTLWVAGLVLVLGVGLAIFINSLTAIQIPQVLRVELAPTLLPLPNDPINAQTLLPEETRQSPSIPVSSPTSLQESVIRQVRWISLTGIGLFALAGAAGAYWIARRSLAPVRRLSQLAQSIEAKTLNRRLPLDGPQDEVKELAEAFNKMLERLESSFEQQSRFVSDAAHELRTPLATLRANIEVLQHDPNANVADYREMTVVLERSLSRMEKLVEDLLILARGEKEVRTEMVNLSDLIVCVVQDVEPLAQSHRINIDLNLTDQVTVRADFHLLGRAVSNLLENGVRYNRPGGSVTLTVQRRNKGVVISVEDTGIGISPEDQPHVFERFYRADQSRARHSGGAGLGLSIAKHIVQLHGGHIHMTSIPGTGSIFTIWLPADESCPNIDG